jgi:hypothetical protein
MHKTREAIDAQQEAMTCTERPILFSTPMVQAILEGRKDRTRRTKGLDTVNKLPSDYDILGYTCDNGKHFAHFVDTTTGEVTAIPCPYGKPGDILWVRETFTILDPEHLMDGMINRYVYKANCDGDCDELRKEYIKSGYPYNWKPSLFMPRTACRLFLRITKIGVERLQSITEKDAMKEGVEREMMEYEYAYKDYMKNISYHFSPNAAKHSFKTLWIKLNGIVSWDVNPWVWVIEFKKVKICYKTNQPCFYDCNGLCKDSC